MSSVDGHDGQCRDHLIRSYRQALSDQVFQQVTHPCTSVRVHPYVPGLLYSAAAPVRSSTGRAWPRSWRWSTLASAPLPPCLSECCVDDRQGALRSRSVRNETSAACLLEKRKAGGSAPPLTTRSEQGKRPEHGRGPGVLDAGVSVSG